MSHADISCSCDACAGPITAEAIFLNREELPVKPVYYDPVHDFGAQLGLHTSMCTSALSPGSMQHQPGSLPRGQHEMTHVPPIRAGFLRFDPAKVQFMEVCEVPLRPEAAAVGLEVRVVGNDSGEKVQHCCLCCTPLGMHHA